MAVLAGNAPLELPVQSEKSQKLPEFRQQKQGGSGKRRESCGTHFLVNRKENEDKQKEGRIMGDKGSGLMMEDYLIAFFGALAGGIALFLAIGIPGYLITERAAAQAEDVSQSMQAAPESRSVPSAPTTEQNKPTAATVPVEPEPEEQEPIQTDDMPKPEPAINPAKTSDPESSEPAQIQEPAKQLSTSTTNQTHQLPAPTQPEEKAPSQSGTSANNVTIARDFSSGRVLATTQSSNNGNPVYHTKDCQAAKKILPESEYWYDSAQAAENDGRRLCGYCK